MATPEVVVSQVVRRSAASSMVATIAVLTFGGGSVAQVPAVPPLDPADPVRCELWGGGPAPEALRAQRASVGGSGVSAAAVDVEPVIPTCTLSQGSMDTLPTPLGDRILDAYPTPAVFEGIDASGDWLLLAGGAPPATSHASTDITGLTYLTFDADRRAARGIARLLDGGDIGEDAIVTLGAPAADWLKRGTFQVVVLQLAGDPSSPTDTQRIWQLAFEAADPAKAVPPPIPVAVPLAGAQNVLTYGQFPQDDGSVRRFLGRSNFGSDKLGPDGQTRYYNARADAAVVEWDDIIAFIFPEAYDPLGFRGMSYDAATQAWDLTSAPGGPMAFFPASGSSPGMFDVAGLLLDHTPVTLPAFIDGTPSDGPVPFPSGKKLVFGSTIFDPTRAVIVDLGYSVGGHEVVMEEMAAEILGGGLYEVTFGIPQYGTYILTSADFRQDGVTVPDTWDQTLELARALATGTWTVDETEGPLHGPLPQQWVTGPAALPRPYDDEAARILDEAGWTRVR